MKARNSFGWYIGILCFVLSSCHEDKSPKMIEKEGVVVTLPYFVKEDELADDAMIEYANRYRNFYVAGFKLPQELSKDSLWRLSTKRIYSSLEDYKIDTSSFSHEGVTRISGHFKGEKETIFYIQKLLQTQQQSYLLTVWVRGEHREKTYRTSIEDIISSFKIKP